MGYLTTSRHKLTRFLAWLGIPLLMLIGIGLSTAFIDQTLYVAALVVAISGLFVFLRSFEQTVIGILFMRSALDLYSVQQVPAAFAIGVDLLVVFYLIKQILLRQPIHTDRFFWVLFGWVLLQGVWVVLIPTNALGGGSFAIYAALREWMRFFSLAMVYLLTMQLRDRISPDRLASLLLLSLVVPAILAFLQVIHIDLPSFLQSNVGWKDFRGTGDRINSTLGHYNSFATFSLLFLALTMWRLQMAKKRLGWWLIIGGLLYCLIATRSLTGLVMLLVFGSLYFLPRLGGKGFWGAIALTVALSILLSTELGRSRLVELGKTPLLNPDLTVERAIALQAADVTEFRNSFNWRLVQWQDLLSDWQEYPLLGYGLGTTEELSIFRTTSHNDYVRFLVEEGVVGFSLFLLFLLAQVVRVLQVMRTSLPGSPQRALAMALFPYSIALIVGMMAGNVMVHTATFFYWWVLLAVLGWEWPDQFGGKVSNSFALSAYPDDYYSEADDLYDESVYERSPANSAVHSRSSSDSFGTGD